MEVLWGAVGILAAVSGCIVLGKRCELFSSDYVARIPVLRFWPSRWLVLCVVGLVWILARLRFPGLETLVTYSLDNRVGLLVRAAYWKARVRQLGKNVWIGVGARAVNWKNILIGDDSWIDRNVLLLAEDFVPGQAGTIYERENISFHGKKGELTIGIGCHIAPNVVIQSIGGVYIGDYTGIASGCKIYSLSHHYRGMTVNDHILYKFSPRAPPEEQSLIAGPVVLEGNNALGLNSVILPGVTIGKNSWVGVCSSVTDDIPPDCIAAGCPAKVLKKRFKDSRRYEKNELKA
jgi:acetyltransferase-like isoleucine patch superfamily enzyme